MNQYKTRTQPSIFPILFAKQLTEPFPFAVLLFAVNPFALL